MAGVQNRLSGPARFCSSANNPGEWNAVNLELGEILSSELYPNSEFKQLELLVSDGQTNGELTLGPIQLLSSDSNRPMILVFAVKIPSGGTITTSLIDESGLASNIVTTNVNAQQAAAAVNAPGILSPQWFIFRSESITIDADTELPTISIIIEFEPSNPNEKFYFTTPAVYHKYEFFIANQAVAAVASQMPQVFIDIDADADSSPDVPMLRFIDVATVALGESLETTGDFAYLDTEDGYEDSDDSTKSTLVNHDVAELSTLLWLAKFNGTRPVLRFNSSLDIEADPFVLDVSQLDGDDVIRLTSYAELNPPALNIAAQESLLRWQMEYGYYGRNAGTVPAVVESAKLMLIDSQSASVSHDYDQEPFVIDLQTYWYETLGAIGPEAIGEPSQLVLEAVERARPLGTLIRHEMIG
jgi:hypothetical protein